MCFLNSFKARKQSIIRLGIVKAGTVPVKSIGVAAARPCTKVRFTGTF
jgi:hypothetical protein